MTEQEKQEIIEELKKSLAEEKYVQRTDGSHTALKEPRDKWFCDTEGGYYSKMAEIFGRPSVAWQAWEAIRRLTCLIHGKQYVRHLVGDDMAADTAEKLCQFVYDLRMEVQND